MLKYTVYRLGLFLFALLVLLLIRVEPLWAVLLAGLFSMVTSLFLLVGPREEAARTLETRVEKSKERRAEKLASQRTDEEGHTDEDVEDAEAEGR